MEVGGRSRLEQAIDIGEPEDEIHPANEFPGERPHTTPGMEEVGRRMELSPRMCGPVIIGD